MSSSTRDCFIQIRVTKDEREALRRCAAAHGLDMAKYLRGVGLGDGGANVMPNVTRANDCLLASMEHVRALEGDLSALSRQHSDPNARKAISHATAELRAIRSGVSNAGLALLDCFPGDGR